MTEFSNKEKLHHYYGQRGQWMISHVYAILGRGEEALESAQKTMRLTKQHSFKDFKPMPMKP